MHGPGLHARARARAPAPLWSTRSACMRREHTRGREGQSCPGPASAVGESAQATGSGSVRSRASVRESTRAGGRPAAGSDRDDGGRSRAALGAVGLLAGTIPHLRPDASGFCGRPARWDAAPRSAPIRASIGGPARRDGSAAETTLGHAFTVGPRRWRRSVTVPAVMTDCPGGPALTDPRAGTIPLATSTSVSGATSRRPARGDDSRRQRSRRPAGISRPRARGDDPRGLEQSPARAGGPGGAPTIRTGLGQAGADRQRARVGGPDGSTPFRAPPRPSAWPRAGTIRRTTQCRPRRPASPRAAAIGDPQRALRLWARARQRFDVVGHSRATR